MNILDELDAAGDRMQVHVGSSFESGTVFKIIWRQVESHGYDLGVYSISRICDIAVKSLESWIGSFSVPHTIQVRLFTGFRTQQHSMM